MTNEQAIKWLKDYIQNTPFQMEQYERAFEMAIQALSQEPTEKPMCDRNICISNEYNGIGCDECIINKVEQDPCDELVSREAVIKTLHNTIFQFFDVCGDDEETPMSDKDEFLLTINKAISNNIKALLSVTQKSDEQLYKNGFADGYEQGHKDAEHKSGKWIPASKRLPEKGGEYLITWTGVCGKQRSKPLIGIAEYEIYEPENYEDWITTDNEFRHYHDIKVLAWQELPKPYEPQESEEQTDAT